MLTASQLAALKTDIAAQPSLASAVAAQNWPTIAAFYNAPSSPAVTIWRTDVPADEIVAAITFADLITLSVQQVLALQVLITPGTVDATSANIRTDFSTLFTGKGSLAALTALAERTATRLEALFTTNQVSAVYGYALDVNDVVFAMTGRTS